MPLYRIDRVKRHGKPLRAPELMHSGVLAENPASALAYYRALYPRAKLDELVATTTAPRGPARKGAA